MKENLNFVKFDEVFDLATSYWPESIPTKERTLHKNGGATFPELIEIHDNIENKVLEANNHLLRFMDWSIFSQLHNAAIYLDIVRPSELNRKAVRQKFEESLFNTPELDQVITIYKQENK